jgi:hypothetical protein
MGFTRLNPNPWILDYRSNDTSQYASAATSAAAGMVITQA